MCSPSGGIRSIKFIIVIPRDLSVEEAHVEIDRFSDSLAVHAR